MAGLSIGEERTFADHNFRSGSSFPPGHILGQYRLIRLLGRGGMGEVYAAEHSTLGLRYALKLLPPDFASRSGALERFRKEARVMAQLQHPNIVKVDEFGETGGRYWLRMELMSGVGEGVISLADLTNRCGGIIEQKQLLSILKQVVEGLDYAHSRGAVHRDLKPGNILLEKDSSGEVRAKVSDFGLVRLVGEEWVRNQAQVSVQRSLSLGEKATEAAGEGTSTKALLGTYEYMSPEQKRGEEADERSDIYALGMIAYRLLTGQELGMSTPTQIDPALATAWDELARSALEQNRESRLADCRALAGLLAKVEEDISRLDREAEERRRREAKEAARREREDRERREATDRMAREAADARRAREEADRREKPTTDSSSDRAREDRSRSIPNELPLDLGEGLKLELVWIAPGNFLMGSTSSEVGRAKDEGPQHRVEISRGFWMGKYQVTQEQYRRLIDSNPSFFSGDRLPVEGVSWDDAKEFCNKLNRSRPAGTPEGFVFRLPTEAEWEYACRAGTTTPYYFGDDSGQLEEYAWFSGNIFGKTQPVGRKKPNGWGLHDMHGNVWEWCEDYYDRSYYAKSTGRDPAGPGSGSSRVLRGGSWFSFSRHCRSSTRFYFPPGNADRYVGFRVVLAVR